MTTKDNRAEKLRAVYKNAEKFLYEIAPPEVTGDEMERYFVVSKEQNTKSDILHGLLLSLQNRQMASNVIGFYREDRVPVFKEIFFDYDADAILRAYTADTLLECFKERFNIKVENPKRNLWAAYAKSVISACKFLSGFDSAEEFDEFVMRFTYNEFTAAALPMLLEKEISGMGFALACDFLKDLGYTGYAKPDVHIKDILSAFDLCEDKDYDAYKTIIEMANAVGETPYKVDKVLWMIGSGNFYLHNVTVGRNKEKFTEKAKTYL